MKFFLSAFFIATAGLAATVPRIDNDAISMYLSQFKENTYSIANYNESDLTFDPGLIKIFYYSRKTKSGKEISIKNAKDVKQTDYSPSKNTFFITHGWVNDHRAPMCQKVKDAYLAAGDVNVFVVDWSLISFAEYALARNQVIQIGKIVADFISSMVSNKLLSLDKTTFIGHSLGAHIAGTTGKALNKKLGTIIGLDPAGPLVFLKISNNRLDKTDAKFVQVLHTCAGRLGFSEALGHADYWPNGGQNQPACPGVDVAGVCNHALAYEYFAESVKTGHFEAWSCSSFKDFVKSACKSHSESFFGQLTIDKRATGNYYFETNSKSPFAKGEKKISMEQ